jgi:Fe-S cluster assembly ATP-binding protein
MTATAHHELEIRDLRAGVAGQQILHGVNLVVRSGEVHAVMGPNGSGKSTLSHVIMGKPGYEVLGGQVLLDGADVLALAPWERAVAGLFLAMQYPIEVPGVSLSAVMRAALAARGSADEGLDQLLEREADRIGFDHGFLARPLNVDLSGGEKKRNETLQMSVLAPKFAILDELDSGLDLDALRDCARRVEAATHEAGLGVLAITHYTRLLTELHPDRVHILVKGQIVESGGPELADDLEASGYARWVTPDAPVEASGALNDLFAL